MIPKVLIGCPTYSKQEFCLNKFAEGLNAVTYPNCQVLFMDNSEGDEYFEVLKKLKINKAKSVLKDQHLDTRIARIISSRNIIREHFLAGDCDYLFLLDTDIIPPKEVIEKLIHIDTDIASGVYLCRQKIGDKYIVLPALYKAHGEDSVITLTKEEVMQNNIIEIAVCGLGCCLIRKEVIKCISFRALSDSRTGGEDVAFCTDAKKKGFKIMADTKVKCSHLGEKMHLLFQ